MKIRLSELTFAPESKSSIIMKRDLFLIIIFLFSVSFLSAKSDSNELYHSESDIVIASWYGPGFHGKKTASGEIYNMNALTAAHKKLSFGTKVKVTNIRNGKSVIVVINDRGPYVGNRKFDLSKAAFHKIAKKGVGLIKIKYKILN